MTRRGWASASRRAVRRTVRLAPAPRAQRAPLLLRCRRCRPHTRRLSNRRGLFLCSSCVFAPLCAEAARAQHGRVHAANALSGPAGTAGELSTELCGFIVVARKPLRLMAPQTWCFQSSACCAEGRGSQTPARRTLLAAPCASRRRALPLGGACRAAPAARLLP